MRAMVIPANFFPGDILATKGVRESVSPEDVFAGLGRHMNADWGDVDELDWKANDEALENGGRLLSVYRATSGRTFWIITECDRSSTTVLLPDEY